MSLNTIKQRINLYNRTFMKWSVERRLSTLEKANLDAALALHNFGNNATDANYKKFCEELSDLETMIEVSTLTFPSLRSKMDEIKKQKLTVLSKQQPLLDKADELKEQAELVPEQIRKQKEEKKEFEKHFWNRFRK